MASVAEQDAGSVASGAWATHPVSQRLGSVIANTYRLTRHIGSGGSSHVFAAEHLRLGRAFAVKLLRPELDPTHRTASRLRREARVAAGLNSDYVVSVIDCGELDDQTPYIVMELLEGEDLRSLIVREGPLPARRAVQIVSDACRGLASAHDAGLVHRDLKPENLFLTRPGSGKGRCKLLDFGVAKLDGSATTTAEGALIGTIRYMAPEQLANAALVGVATDIHALGTILYECLSGRAPHGGESAQEVMYKIMNQPPADLAGLRVALPAELVRTVHACLAKDPAKRPASATQLREMLARSLAAVPPQSDTTISEEAVTPLEAEARGRRSPLPGVGLVVLALGIGLVLGRYSRVAASSPPTRVQVAKIAEARSAPLRSARVVDAACLAPSHADTPKIRSGSSASAGSPPTPARAHAQGRLASTAAPASSHVVPEIRAVSAVGIGSFDTTDPYQQ